MASHGVHHNYSSEPLSSFSVPFVAPERKSPCPQCCQACENQVRHPRPLSHIHCDTSQPSNCGCNLNSNYCSRQPSCCPAVGNVVVPTPQGCSYRSSGSDHSSSRSCFCPQQQSAFSRVSHPHYSLHQLHLPPTGVPFAPIPVAGAVAFPQVFSAVHASQEGLSGFADDPSDLGHSRETEDDGSHYHTHIHHHIHRYQHPPYSCVSLAHHHLPAMTVPSQFGHSRHWRHSTSRSISTPYSYLHLPVHFHPYLPRVLPTAFVPRSAAGVFSSSTSELDPDQIDQEWTGREAQPSEPRGLTKLEIEQLPVYMVTKDSKKNDDEETRCVICISDFDENEYARILPCSHKFHSKCVDRWLKSNPTCPICRAVVQVTS